uniref:Uncharacterized protein n=1 Tax=Skeletonema marinoi TaxID=267567 RepID=A0A6U3XD84_9STRA|mmetsp:Transcript_29914/g.50959  ORF Transcript_29914/g.50959 Transcript_29914/m.50959 type:complete len:389 (+) Transcript_29914:641-1807(+)
MCNFVGENNNLRSLDLMHVKPENESAQHFALMLEQRQSKSLQRLALQDNDLGDEEIEAIATALSRQASLEELVLMENDFGRLGCVALGTTLERWQAPNLKQLVLSYNNIDDAGLQALVAGLVNCINLEELQLSYNHSITAVGLRSLAAFFQSEHCCLEEFEMAGVYFGDEGAIALADGLVGNTSIESMTMYIDSIESTHFRTAPLITEVGWSAFSKLLCNTSSINSTYMSNHTLAQICQHPLPPPYICKYLQLNAFQQHQNIDTAKIAKIKILLNHPDLDMEPFFQKQLKLLPHVMSWFQRARSCHSNSSPSGRVLTRTQSQKHVLSRELSAVYKFIRGMPMVAADGYCKYVLKTALKRKRKLQLMIQKAEEEEEWAQKRLKPEPEYD